MVTRKKVTPSVAAATPVPAIVPQAPAQAVLAVPAKLPARKRAAVKKALVLPIALPQAVPEETPGQPALAAPEKTPAPEKTKKSRRVRDSFSMPKSEYAVLDGLKQRAARLEHRAKKSELVRAGIQLLAALPDDRFVAALAQIQSLKRAQAGSGK